MRLGRAAFWQFFLCNALVVAALIGLLPQVGRVASPQVRDILGAAQSFSLLLAFALLLPSVWMGMRRLHDTGHFGGQAWLPALPLAVMGILPHALPLVQQMLVATLLHGGGSGLTGIFAKFGVTVIIGLWLGALLVAAGTLRTFFLWAEPGDAGDNRYGPPTVQNTASAGPAVSLLKGRMKRIVFWPLVFANMLITYGVSYVVDHWPPMHAMASHASPPSSMLSAWLFLPSFAAAILRLQDRGRSGALAVLAFAINAAAPFAEHVLDASAINLMNIAVDIVTICLLYQCWQPGDSGDNRYGPSSGAEAVVFEPVPPSPRVTPARPSGGASPVLRSSPSRSFGRRGA